MALFPRGSAQTTNSSIHVVYSPTCPHCHALMSYLEEKGVKFDRTQDGREAARVLLRNGIDWKGGVPVMYTVVNGTVYAVEGFPAGSQLKDGYFLGREREEELCSEMGGKPYHYNGSYRFCKLPNGMFLGNVYSVDYVVGQAKAFLPHSD